MRLSANVGIQSGGLWVYTDMWGQTSSNAFSRASVVRVADDPPGARTTFPPTPFRANLTLAGYTNASTLHC